MFFSDTYNLETLYKMYYSNKNTSYWNENKYIILSIPLFIIIAVVFSSIYGILNTNHATYIKPTTKNGEWNNRNMVIYIKELINQWQWTYSNNNSEFKQACNTWAHDSLFFADDTLISYYDNKVLSGRDRSYLRNYNGEITHEVESGSAWQTIINFNKIWVNYIIYNNNSNIIGYIDGTSLPYIENDYNIKNTNGDIIVNLNRNKVTLSNWKWVLTQTNNNNNTIPLSLAVSIASKISFSDDDKTDLCNKLFTSSYIVLWVFVGCSLIAIGVNSYLFLKYKFFQKN